MAPNVTNREVLHLCKDEMEPVYDDKPLKREYKLVWRNIILYIVLHISALYGIYMMLTSAKLLTTIFGKLI